MWHHYGSPSLSNFWLLDESGKRVGGRPTYFSLNQVERLLADLERDRALSPGIPPPEVGLAGVKHIVYGRGDQIVWLVAADGSVFDSYYVSGRATWPRPGRYKVFSKSPITSSIGGSLSMEHMVRFLKPPGKAATGFHSIPVNFDGTPVQTEEELGQFLSAGCVRQRDDKAEKLYDWTPIGTPVVVLT